MTRSFCILVAYLFGCVICNAVEPDMIVTQDGESIKVYNLEITSKTVYYTLTEDSEADVKKLSVNSVLVIKKNDGSIINPNDTTNEVATTSQFENKNANPAAHDPVYHKAAESDFFIVEKKGKKNQPNIIEKYILVDDGDKQILNMKVLSEVDKTLSVSEPRKDMKYELTEYIIPDYVMIGNDKYSVVEIGVGAFYGKGKLENVVFPETLKSIQPNAFSRCTHLRRIVLPESLENIYTLAFSQCGRSCPTFEQLYIPKNVKVIGENAFWYVGPKTSWKAYYQGNLTSIPDFVSVGNCTSYGIDEEAVEAYERRNK